MPIALVIQLAMTIITQAPELIDAIQKVLEAAKTLSPETRQQLAALMEQKDSFVA